ncbi:amidase [Janibacter cremeus]|uniref:amidase n=1 Tax=Janibacter cremeus TaxID=1285192 RepID=UPI0023F84DF0|nr:amidase [Janibacter cremeus]WEV76905.1 amidase [Janibacter cremeus]
MTTDTSRPAPHEQVREDHESRRVSAFTGDALGTLDATGVAEEIRSGRISAQEAVEAAIARVEAVDPVLGATMVRDFERARRRAGHVPTGTSAPFAGVPSAIKDNVHHAGLPMTMGSDALPTAAVTEDGPFVKQFLSTGVMPVATTTCPPFGWTATTERPDGRVTRNPWDTGYSAGGSSGGSAALVASGALPIAHGNDGGGSIRIPAAACGLVGLKATRGRLLGDPTTDQAPIRIVVNGALTRTVRDTANFIAAAERYQPSRALPPVGLVEGPGARRLRIGMMLDSPLIGPSDPQTRAAVEAVGALLEDLGHDLEADVDVPIPQFFKTDFEDYWGLLALATKAQGKGLYGEDFDPARLDRLTLGLAAKAKRRLARTPLVLARLAATGIGAERLFPRQLDLVLTPTLCHTTPRIGYLSGDLDFETHMERLTQYVGFTPLHNASGQPSISLPLGRTDDGRPIGVMFSARRGQERLLLELAFELEAAVPFARLDD